ncbi:cysteine protease [Trapelia coarctata]|nr:cysteine protease [Trapelia coarctata]
MEGESVPSDLESQLTEAERQVHGAKSWKSAYSATLDATELCLRALKLTSDNDKKKLLDEQCRKLLDQAERIKSSEEWPSDTLEVWKGGTRLENDAPKKELKQPLSTRTLSTREQIILLQGSKLNGCVFPPWKASPAADEFALTGTDIFTDPTEFRFGREQLEVFDGWRRPSEVLSIDGLKAENHSDGIQPTMMPDRKIDLVQDMTSDCSVVASLCAGTARAESGHTRIISSIMYPYDFSTMTPAMSPNGKYIIKLHFNGCHRKVIVDDRLPASRTARSLHVLDRNNPGLLWPALMEKAYLKVRGGYDFPGSNSGTDLWVLTGWIPEQLFLQRCDFGDSDIFFVALKRQLSNGVCVSDDIIPNLFWRRILNAHNFGDVLMTIGTGRLTRREEQGLGLASEHDYAITDLKEEDGRRLLLIKNPWSERSSWKGRDAFGKELHAGPDTTALALQSESLPPGTFWMELDEVLQNFETIYLNWNPGLFAHRQDVHFSWDLTANRRPSGSFCRNPQHFQDSPLIKEDKTGIEASVGFLSLYAFDKNGQRAILSDGSLVRSPYVDAPNTLLRLELPAKSVYTIVISEQDLPQSTYNFTLSVFALKRLDIALADDKYKHNVTQSGAWTFSTAGGNASSPAYHTNPQFSLCLSGHSNLAILLEAEDDDIPVHVKLLWVSGKRALQITTRDIVGDSGDYRRGSALAEISNVQAGTYTLICSIFEQGRRSKFSLIVRSMEECTIRAIPLAEAGRLQIQVPTASFSEGLDRLLAPLQVSRITRLRLRARNKDTTASTRSPLRMSLEYGQGPHKHVLSITGNSEFMDAPAGLRTEDVDIIPRMCTDHGVWLVVERLGRSYNAMREGVQIEILSDHAVGVGPWGTEMDEPVEKRAGWSASSI